jgi:hypothetical protein
MKKVLLLIATLLHVSCAKEEFAPMKGNSSSSSAALSTDCGTLYASSTLVSPKVDVLLLWDNSSSALFINQYTKASYNQLIASVSEKFDYHILSAPLISTSSNTLNEASLVVKDTNSVNAAAASIVRTKDQAAAALNFTYSSGSIEPGIDRVLSIIETNRANGIFRNDAYTIIVVMSNGDDTSCESATGFSSCSAVDWKPRLQTKINKLLCLRGNANADCSGVTTLNSTMMRFINISKLNPSTSCLGKVNERYRNVAKALYEAPYVNGWPTSNDNLNPFMKDSIAYPDNYDFCSMGDMTHIFDGVNTAIKQTLLKHVYEFWPVAGLTTSIDPSAITVTRIPDGKVLANRTNESNPTDGFKYIGNVTDHYTRILPTRGENFTGKMIQLFGAEGNDKLVYPQALKVCYQDFKAKYGYVFLTNGKPNISTLEVYIDGVKIPQNTTNGWDYMGLQYTSTLDQNYKIYSYPQDATSGYFIRLNGDAQRDNTTSVKVDVYYTSVQ